MSINRARPHPGDGKKDCANDASVDSVGSMLPDPDLAAYVEQVVEQAPPLTSSQQDSLSVLLKGVRA